MALFFFRIHIALPYHRGRMTGTTQTWMVAAISAVILLGGAWPGPGRAQQAAVTNPVAGNAAAIREGASLFRSNCSPCHGPNAQGGGRGPDLTSGRWVHGSRDAEIFATITR